MSDDVKTEEYMALAQRLYEQIQTEVKNAGANFDFNDVNVEMPLMGKRRNWVIVLWGHDDDYGDKWYDISIRRKWHTDQPGKFEWFYSDNTSPEALAEEIKIALATLDKYLDEMREKRKKKKFRRGGHILSLDELARQEYIYWNDKVTHCGWFLSWQFRMAKNTIGEHGCIYYAIREDDE